MKTLKVEGNNSLVRDVESKAILNTNMYEYEEYMAHKKLALDKKTQIDHQAADINMLKQDMLEIKQMLSMLVKGKE
jgi:hypothetical protein